MELAAIVQKNYKSEKNVLTDKTKRVKVISVIITVIKNKI